MNNLRSTRGIFVLILIAFAPLYGVRAQIVVPVSVDTSPLVGSAGFIDIQFNPGVDSLGAIASIRNFSTDGLLAGTSQNLGGAVGILPGPPDVSIANSDGFNDLFQGITFGAAITFDLEFDGPALNPSEPYPYFGSVFAVSLLDVDEVSPLLTTSIDGVLARVDLNPNGSLTGTTYSDSSGVYRATVAVPELTVVQQISASLAVLCVSRIVLRWRKR